VKKRKKLSIIGIITGGIAILMIFVIPFFIPRSLDDYAWIYFITFLTLVGVGNITMEKSQRPLSLKEERKEKLKDIGL